MVISYITTPVATWFTLLALLSVHLALNYKAVRAVQMTTLNRQRANIVFSVILGSDPGVPFILHHHNIKQQRQQPDPNHNWKILTPAQTSTKEYILEPDGLVKWHTSPTSSTLGTARIGISMHEYLCTPGADTATLFPTLTTIFAKEAYVLTITRQRTSSVTKNFITPAGLEKRERLWRAGILLKGGSSDGGSGESSRVQLKAWLHAVLVMRVLPSGSSMGTGTGTGIEQDIVQVLEKTLGFLNQRVEGYLHALQTGGWEVENAALETSGSRRVFITPL